METYPTNTDNDQNVLIRISPLVNSKKYVPCFLVTFSPVDGSRETCQAAFAECLPTLQNVNVKFLAELAGGGRRDGQNEIDTSVIAPNVGVMHPDNQIVDGVIRTRSMEYRVGWENLCESKPSQEKTQLSPSEATLLHVLNCVMRDAELKEVVGGIKRDAALQYRLMQYLNRAYLGHRFTSFENAVVFLGYRELERWLTMFLVMEVMPKQMPAKMAYPIFFGKKMELLSNAKGHSPDMGGNIFIAGVFLVLSKILGKSYSALLESLGDNDALHEVLIDKSGLCADLSAFVQNYDQCAWHERFSLTKAFHLTPREINQAEMRSFEFAFGCAG